MLQINKSSLVLTTSTQLLNHTPPKTLHQEVRWWSRDKYIPSFPRWHLIFHSSSLLHFSFQLLDTYDMYMYIYMHDMDHGKTQPALSPTQHASIVVYKCLCQKLWLHALYIPISMSLVSQLPDSLTQKPSSKTVEGNNVHVILSLTNRIQELAHSPALLGPSQTPGPLNGIHTHSVYPCRELN